jgi:hypothetical protein
MRCFIFFPPFIGLPVKILPVSGKRLRGRKTSFFRKRSDEGDCFPPLAARFFLSGKIGYFRLGIG